MGLWTRGSPVAADCSQREYRPHDFKYGRVRPSVRSGSMSTLPMVAGVSRRRCFFVSSCIRGVVKHNAVLFAGVREVPSVIETEKLSVGIRVRLAAGKLGRRVVAVNLIDRGR